MKLKSKLTVGVTAMLLLALFACCTVILSISRKSILDSSVSHAQTELQRLEDNLLKNRVDMEYGRNELTVRSMLKYYFSRQAQASDSHTEYVLLQDKDTIYNNSGLDPAAVLHLNNSEDMQTKVLRLTEGDFIVCGEPMFMNNVQYQIYLVQNITGTYGQLAYVSGICLTIGLAVSVIAGLFIVFFLQRTLRPLEQLKREAEAIADGEYEARLDIKGKDELASLSCSFNKMAESVEQHIRQVEETSEARNRLIHALSHEMRTPVTAICGYAYALRSVKMKEEQKEEALEFIDLEAKRLERLSGKLMDLVGISGGKSQLHSIDLADMRKQLEMILRHRNIRLEIAEGHIYGDQDLLLMLITNLCDNAKKAGATEIVVKVTVEGIWVQDNGKGIPKAEQAHIFEAFYQGDASRNQEGFGLGLALCQKIAGIHHTSLQVSSEEGKGSTFYLYNSFTTC